MTCSRPAHAATGAIGKDGRKDEAMNAAISSTIDDEMPAEAKKVVKASLGSVGPDVAKKVVVDGDVEAEIVVGEGA